MSPRIAENQRMSTPNKKFVKSMIILGCNWLTVSKIKKQRESLVSLVCYGWKGRREKGSYTSLQFSYMLVMDINSICKTQLTDTYEERIFSK